MLGVDMKRTAVEAPGQEAAVAPKLTGRRPSLFAPRRKMDRAPTPDRSVQSLAISTQNLRRDAVFRRTLAAADLLAVTISLGAIFSTRLTYMAIVAVPGFVVLAKLRGLYDWDTLLLNHSTIDEVPPLFGIATLYTLLIWFGGWEFFKHGPPLHRYEVILFWGLLCLTLTIGRTLARAAVRRFASVERCMFIGPHSTMPRLEAALSGRHGLELVSHFPIGENPDGSPMPVARAISASRDQLRELVEGCTVHRAIVAIGDAPDEGATLDAIMLLEGQMGVKVSVLMNTLAIVGSADAFEELGSSPLLGVGRFGLTRSSILIKRTFDVAVTMMMLIMLAPIFVAIALAVKLTSPGPVFYRQRRIGQEGRPFVMVKFRTMVQGADTMHHELAGFNETKGLFKLTDDPRVTRVGRRLRRSSLDELPQLWNVLRGEMSLVGPRPLVPHEDDGVRGWERRRLKLVPGMTGAWQVLGSARVPLRDMVKIDYRYIATWTLWTDVKALLRTVPHVLRRRGL